MPGNPKNPPLKIESTGDFAVGKPLELLPKKGILCWTSSTPALPWRCVPGTPLSYTPPLLAIQMATQHCSGRGGAAWSRSVVVWDPGFGCPCCVANCRPRDAAPRGVSTAQPSWPPRDCKAEELLFGAVQVRRVPGEALGMPVAARWWGSFFFFLGE